MDVIIAREDEADDDEEDVEEEDDDEISIDCDSDELLDMEPKL